MSDNCMYVDIDGAFCKIPGHQCQVIQWFGGLSKSSSCSHEPY